MPDMSLVEAIWLLLTTPALVFHLWMVRDTHEDLAYLVRCGINGDRQVVASKDRRTEIARSAIQFLFVAVGFGAAAIPEYVCVPPIPYMSRLAFLVVAGIILVMSIMDRRARQKLLRAEERAEDRAADRAEDREAANLLRVEERAEDRATDRAEDARTRAEQEEE